DYLPGLLGHGEPVPGGNAHAVRRPQSVHDPQLHRRAPAPVLRDMPRHVRPPMKHLLLEEADPMRTSLVLKAITKLFPTGDGVRDVDLELVPGEIHALVGLNGAGKSTLMQLMLGMKAPDSGIMTLNGVPFDEIS